MTPTHKPIKPRRFPLQRRRIRSLWHVSEVNKMDEWTLVDEATLLSTCTPFISYRFRISPKIRKLYEQS